LLNNLPQSAADRAPLIVVMGVSGSGKSTVANMLAHRLHCPMLEGDSLHSRENIHRMSMGTPLTDEDRRPWLAAIAACLSKAARESRGLVVACSALKRAARDVLRGDAQLIFVYLAGTRQLLEARLAARHGHFMPKTLLDSQLQSLEEPGPDERAIVCDISETPTAIVERIVSLLESPR
jgi:carbohydrate kinase (thermoresistant glucokinase family)